MLESLYDENHFENCQKIWQIIFMLIMRDEMIDVSINRRRLFERKNAQPEPEGIAENLPFRKYFLNVIYNYNL